MRLAFVVALGRGRLELARLLGINFATTDETAELTIDKPELSPDAESNIDKCPGTELDEGSVVPAEGAEGSMVCRTLPPVTAESSTTSLVSWSGIGLLK